MADCENPDCRPIRNIVIEDNIVDCPKCQYGIFVRNVDGVEIRRNKVVGKEEAVHVEVCSNVTLEE